MDCQGGERGCVYEVSLRWPCQKDYARVISARDQSGCHWSRFGANVGEVGLGTGSEWYRCSRTRPVRSSQALCDIELSELKKRD